ncbi:MAG: TatD family hydrolase [Anaerolineae bacterium]|nr:TatD family hydrolase [Anaerolineae bacterium]
MLIDTHCHLDFNAYDDDRDAVMARAAAAGVTRVINPATDAASGAAALQLADRYPGVFVAVGIHPNDTARYQAADLDTIRDQANHPKVVAIGEIGLDYYRDWSPKEQQRAAFEDQLTLAAQLGLPVIIHNREASDDVLAVLAAWVPTLPAALRARPGVLHSFSAPRQAAQQALDLGFYLGFTGPITYKNADDLRSAAAAVPLDRLLVETDGPFLTPLPYRGKRNEPAYVAYVADRLAALHNTTVEAIHIATTANAERLFNLPPATD